MYPGKDVLAQLVTEFVGTLTRASQGGRGGGGGKVHVPLFQQNLPCVPVFSKSISSILVFPVP